MTVERSLKAMLTMLTVLLAVVLTSWFTSEYRPARADGGGGGAAGDWIMVASTLRDGEGLVYALNTKKEVLLVYAYHRGKKSSSKRLFTGDLQFLAGRHCKWDVLYSQLLPYPTEKPKSGMHTPAQIQDLHNRASKRLDN